MRPPEHLQVLRLACDRPSTAQSASPPRALTILLGECILCAPFWLPGTLAFGEHAHVQARKLLGLVDRPRGWRLTGLDGRIGATSWSGCSPDRSQSWRHHRAEVARRRGSIADGCAGCGV